MPSSYFTTAAAPPPPITLHDFSGPNGMVYIAIDLAVVLRGYFLEVA